MVETNDAAIRNLEVQIEQLAKIVEGRVQDRLPSNTVINPEETVMAITLRSGKTLEDPPLKEKVVKNQVNSESNASS